MKEQGIQYNININQYALHKTKLDLVDCAILDYLKKFCGVDDKKIRQLTITEGGKMYQYTWINFNYLIKQMPLLRIKDKSAVSRRVDKIKKEGLIKIFRAPDRSLYVRLTEKIKEIEFASVAEKQQNKGERCCLKATGVLLDNNRGVVKKQQHNNNTNNNNTNNNKEEDLISKDTRSFNIRSAKQGFASPEKENSPVSLSEQKDSQPPIPPNPLPLTKANTPAKSKPKSYGNEDINHLYDYLKNKLLGTPDGTVKQNRIFAQHLLNKFRKDYPDKNPVETICLLIDFALEDEFHKKNATSFKYLYYNSQKIIQSTKGRLSNPKYISLKK